MNALQAEWAQWMRAAAEYIETYVRSCEGMNGEPSEIDGKDLVVQFYAIQPKAVLAVPRLQRSEPGGYAEPTVKRDRDRP